MSREPMLSARSESKSWWQSCCWMALDLSKISAACLMILPEWTTFRREKKKVSFLTGILVVESVAVRKIRMVWGITALVLTVSFATWEFMWKCWKVFGWALHVVYILSSHLSAVAVFRSSRSHLRKSETKASLVSVDGSYLFLSLSLSLPCVGSSTTTHTYQHVHTQTNPHTHTNT